MPSPPAQQPPAPQPPVQQPPVPQPAPVRARQAPAQPDPVEFPAQDATAAPAPTAAAASTTEPAPSPVDRLLDEEEAVAPDDDASFAAYLRRQLHDEPLPAAAPGESPGGVGASPADVGDAGAVIPPVAGDPSAGEPVSWPRVEPAAHERIAASALPPVAPPAPAPHDEELDAAAALLEDPTGRWATSAEERRQQASAEAIVTLLLEARREAGLPAATDSPVVPGEQAAAQAPAASQPAAAPAPAAPAGAATSAASVSPEAPAAAPAASVPPAAQQAPADADTEPLLPTDHLPAIVDGGVTWTAVGLLRLGFPGELVHSIRVAVPHDDLAWTAGVTEVLRSLCRPLPTGDYVLVGPHAPEVAEAAGAPSARSPMWLGALRERRWTHLVVGGDGWRDWLGDEPLAVSWARPEDLPEAVRCAAELGLVLGYGPMGGKVRRARPLDVALAVRELVDDR